MKKIVLFLLLFFFMPLSQVMAVENETKTPVRFIYINGANNNTPAMQEWFFNGINKAHPQIKKAFETSPFVEEKFLKKNNLEIEQYPGIFFWGNRTLNYLETINEGLVTTSMFSPKLAQVVRTLFAHCMHDAIWVQKDHNMQAIVRDLHNMIKSYSDKGEKVVLFGYSAGSFVTYEYFFYKLPAISWENILSKMEFSKAEHDFIKTHKINPTCIDALIQSKLAVYSISGFLVPNSNFEEFKDAYAKLDLYTKDVCAANGSILGTVNYASPLVLFYSDLEDPTLEITQYNSGLFKYMKDNDIFWLTVNFADDPLGYPLSRNLTSSEISTMNNIEFNPNGKGFFYDKSNVKSPATFLGAHTSYWKHSKKFAKAIADAYEEGYLNFYPQEKVLTTDKKSKKNK